MSRRDVGEITRFIAYLPDKGDRGREERGAALGRLSDLNLVPLITENYLLAAEAEPPARPVAGATLLLDVFLGSAVSPRLAAAGFDRAASMESLRARAEQSVQCYNLIQAESDVFLMESDALGLKPVYCARTAGGHVLGSRIPDLVFLFPELAQPADAVALFELMCFWVPLADRTLHEKIRRSVPGGQYHWTPGNGLTEARVHDLKPVTPQPMRSDDEIITDARNVTGRALAEKIEGAPQPLLMALSGGFDSRFIAALLKDHGANIRALSFGLTHNEEWHSAREVARALEFEVERVAYPPDNTFERIAEHLDATDGTADPAAVSIAPLLDVSSPVGSPLIHGFCGDLQAGRQINRLSGADYASRESMADAVMRHYFATGRPELQRLFDPVIDLEAVRADVLAGLRSDCPPHEAYMLWYLENRNRRYVGSQFALLGRHFDMVLPFYDRRLFDLWHAVPPVGLTNRAVFRRMLARYYPALARIAHPEEPAAIIPNLKQQLGRFYRGLPARALARLIGAERAKQFILSRYRHNDILTLSILAAPQQQARMLARIDALKPEIQDVLGLTLKPGYETVLTSHLQSLRSLFLAAEYAARQPKSPGC